MRKKDLLNITLPDVPEELIETAQNDKYANNEFVLWNCQTTVEKSYKTRLYFGASEENGILIVRMWPRILLAQGVNKPLSVTYIDAEAEKWISMTDGKWSEALLENIKAVYTHQPKTFWGARDVSTRKRTRTCATAHLEPMKTMYTKLLGNGRTE